MKNIYAKLALVSLLMPVFGHTAESSSWKKSPTKIEVVTKTTPFYEYHNRVILFSPTHQGYERIKPDSLYWGIEGWISYFYNSSRDMKHHKWLMDSEARVGYNFFYNQVDHLTPFVGIGYIQDFSKCYHKEHKPGIIYGAVGFLYDHEFNSVFNLGLNLKGFMGGADTKKHFNWGSPVLGADMSLPVTFRFGHHRHWDLRLEPFNTYLYGSHASAYYVGSRCTLGYRF
jgi:hypothetical protein